jgi:hypothetical protein
MSDSALTSSRWAVRTEGVVWRRVGGDIILMDLGLSVYHSIRGVGADVWVMLTEQQLTVDELVSRLADEYEVELPRLRSDVEGFLSQLCGAELAEPA